MAENDNDYDNSKLYNNRIFNIPDFMNVKTLQSLKLYCNDYHDFLSDICKHHEHPLS